MKRPARVAILTNVVPAYRVPLFEAFQTMVGHLRIFVSSRTVPGRDWHLFLENLDVVVSRTISRLESFENEQGFADESVILIPYDTLWMLLRYRPDVIISGEFGMRTLFSCIYKALFPKTKFILWATLSEHTEAHRGKQREALRRWILRRIDGIFVNGQSGERYVRSLGFSGKPLAHVSYTIDNEAFRGPATRPGDDQRWLFCAGQIIERKGLYPFMIQIVRWCEQHPTRQVKVTLAGAGADLARLKSVCAPANLVIDLPGIATSSQLPGYYHQADISIFPTLADEWGVVVNEALMAGLPIIASRYSQAVEELVTDGVNGWVFDPMDERDTYAAIDRALQLDRTSLDRMRQAAIDACAGLTPHVVAERMLALIQQI